MQTDKPQQTLCSNQRPDWACSHWHQCFQTAEKPDPAFAFTDFLAYFPDPWWDCRLCKRSVKKIDLKKTEIPCWNLKAIRYSAHFPYSLGMQKALTNKCQLLKSALHSSLKNSNSLFSVGGLWKISFLSSSSALKDAVPADYMCFE